MNRIVTIIIGMTITVLLFAAVAFAAGIGGITAGNIGSSDDAVTSCATEGLDVVFNTKFKTGPPPLPAFILESVTISNLPPVDCTGANLLVQLTGAGGVPIGAERDVTDMNNVETVIFNYGLTEDILAEDVLDVHIALVGPPQPPGP